MNRRHLLVGALTLLLIILQGRLWIGRGGLEELHRLSQERTAFDLQVKQVDKKNQVLQAEVDNLQKGGQAIVEQARSELGMISKGETFYLVVHGS